eukprot:365277-Chlamydomonas_euryale.AAC.27
MQLYGEAQPARARHRHRQAQSRTTTGCNSFRTGASAGHCWRVAECVGDAMDAAAATLSGPCGDQA